MKIFAGLIPFNKMPEFKILVKLANWHLDMLQPPRRTLSHMDSVTLSLKEPNCLNIRNLKKRKILPSYTIVLIISHYTSS